MGRGMGKEREFTAFDASREVSMIQSQQLEMGTYQASLRPTRRALRRVRIMVDMLVRCGQWPGRVRDRRSCCSTWKSVSIKSYGHVLEPSRGLASGPYMAIARSSQNSTLKPGSQNK
jgi:hypothetical protein